MEKYREHSESIRSTDVFLWSVAAGAQELAFLLSRWTINPVCDALLGSAMCTSMSHRAGADEEKLRDTAACFEDKITTSLNRLQTILTVGEPRPAVDSQGVQCTHVNDERISLLELASALDMKAFLSHSRCQTIVSTLLNQVDALAVPRYVSAPAILTQIILLPLGYTGLLSVCSDPRQAAWKQAKRGLTLGDQRRLEPKKLNPAARAREFVRVPRVKKVVCNALRLLHALLFASVLLIRADTDPVCSHPGDSPWWVVALEGLLLWWTFNLQIDQLSQHARRGDRKRKLAWGHPLIDSVALSVLVVSLILWWMCFFWAKSPNAGVRGEYVAQAGPESVFGSWTPTPPPPPDAGRKGMRRLDAFSDAGMQMSAGEWSMLLLGLSAIPLLFQLLHIATELEMLGVPMIIMSKMVYDILPFFIVFFAAALGFGLTFVAVMSMHSSWRPGVFAWTQQTIRAPLESVGAKTTDEWTVTSALGIPFWAALGELSLDGVGNTSPVLGPTMLWIYVMISQVILFSLLIAIMVSTFQKHSANAEREFSLYKVTLLMEARALFVVPPPFSLAVLCLWPPAWRPASPPGGKPVCAPLDAEMLHELQSSRSASAGMDKFHGRQDPVWQINMINEKLTDLCELQMKDRQAIERVEQRLHVGGTCSTGINIPASRPATMAPRSSKADTTIARRRDYCGHIHDAKGRTSAAKQAAPLEAGESGRRSASTKASSPPEVAQCRQDAQEVALQSSSRVTEGKQQLKDALACNLSRVVDIFRKMDADGSGTVDCSEFQKAVLMLGVHASDESCNAIFDEYDQDGSGQLVYSEYVRYSLLEALARSHSRVIDLFRQWDEDGTGTIDKREFRQALSSLGFDAPRSDVDAIFDEVDKDDSGQISFRELNKLLRKGGTVQQPAAIQPGGAGKIETCARNRSCLRTAHGCSSNGASACGTADRMDPLRTKGSKRPQLQAHGSTAPSKVADPSPVASARQERLVVPPAAAASDVESNNRWQARSVIPPAASPPEHHISEKIISAASKRPVDVSKTGYFEALHPPLETLIREHNQAKPGRQSSLREQLAAAWPRAEVHFSSNDTQGFGRISKLDFRKAVGVLTLDASRNAVDELFDDLCARDENTISYKRLGGMLRKDALAAEKTVLKQALAASLSRMSDLLREWDEDGSGSIDKKEFTRAIQALGLGGSVVACEAIFDEYDQDDSGQLSHAELIRISLLEALARSHSRVIDLFRQWDEDGTGTIDKREFRQALSSLGFDAPRSDVDAIFDEVDKDDSGQISFRELNKLLRKGGTVQQPAAIQPGGAGKIETCARNRSCPLDGVGRAVSPQVHRPPPLYVSSQAATAGNTRSAPDSARFCCSGSTMGVAVHLRAHPVMGTGPSEQQLYSL